jgi:predicted Holliday junction resolvase-like endonuclease
MTELTTLLAAVMTALAFYLFLQTLAFRRREQEAKQTMQEWRTQLPQLVYEQAREQFSLWREREYETLRAEQRELARREASTQLQRWKYETELLIRSDALRRSQSVSIGKVTEHLAPYLPAFPYNPKDVRFLGSPVDLVIFDGLSASDLKSIIFVEVKTGPAAALSKRERMIRDAVDEGRVQWVEMRVEREA